MPPMYESLVHFLKTFSAESPLLWALLVMAVIAVAGLGLYAFWELLLRGLRLAFSGGRRGNGAASGNGPGQGAGGH